MSAAPPPPSVDLLLAHAGFVRAAARAVLGGDAEVEDVVQETWVKALDRGPREPGALRAWLGRVARNLALDAWRRRSRRERHEGAAARDEALPCVTDIAEREEARRRLVAALLALEEPSRSAVLLRYYEDLPVAQVAARLGVPVETARTRLRRGLERLRERLDAEHGHDRRRWSRALLSWAAPAGGAAIPVALGGLAVKKTLAVAAVTLLALGGGWWALRPEPSRDAGPAPKAPVRREATLPAASPATLVAAAAPGIPAPPATLPYASGTVVDREGRPIAGVAVLARARERLPWGDWQDGGLVFHQALASPAARTDEAGKFELARAVKDQVSLVFLRDGYAHAEWPGLAADPAKNQGLRVVLEPGRRFACAVKDTEGRPIEGARLTLWLRADAENRTLFGDVTTDAAGRCSIGWLAEGPSPVHQLSVSMWGYKGRMLRAPGIADEEAVVLTRTMPIVVLKDAGSARFVAGGAGMLYDDSSLEEPAEAWVAALTSQPYPDRPVSPADLGHLVPAPWPPLVSNRRKPEGSFRALVFAPGYLPKEATFDVEADAEPPRVEVAMSPGEAPVAIRGRVEPATDCTVEIRTPMPRGWGAEDDRQLPLVLRTPVSEAGEFVVRGLPDGIYRLTVALPGFAPAGQDVTAPAEAVRIRLERAAALEVLVLGADGAPAPDRWISVGVEGERQVWDEQSGKDGRVTFPSLPSGTAHVLPRRGYGTRWERMPPHPTLELAPGKTQRVEVRLPARVTTTVRVSDERGRPVAGLDVNLIPRGESFALDPEEWKRVESWSAQTDSTGTASVDLFEGSYEAWVSAGGAKRTAMFKVGREPVAVDVSWAATGGTVRGRVTEVGGAPISGRPVFASIDSPDGREGPNRAAGWVGQTVTDADGRYEMTGLPAGPLGIHFALMSRPPRGAHDADSPYPPVSYHLTLAAGERRERDVVAPRVRGPGSEEPAVDFSVLVTEEGTNAPIAGASVFGDALRGGLWVSVSVESPKTGPDGRAVGRWIRGESYRIRVSRWTRDGRTHELKTIDVAPVADRVDLSVSLAKLDKPVR